MLPIGAGTNGHRHRVAEARRLNLRPSLSLDVQEDKITPLFEAIRDTALVVSDLFGTYQRGKAEGEALAKLLNRKS